MISGPQNHRYLFLHLAKNVQALRRTREAMLAVERSFRTMKEDDRRLARPWHIQEVALPKGGFAELAHRAPASLERAEAQLRLLNGVYPAGEIRPGTRVKTVAE
ncbi:MAG: hypothetical protein CVU17_01495 [Betaproteobacteria bacterium HGW-Betaproteobacteria-11]|nr:MAG: hypothetical protein CVU17_01495 [Betaproteobacteria bacterium HGW-Betaproteobacteria-11]